MIIIDTVLAAPARGLLFILEKIKEAADQEMETQKREIMADLSALHRELDSGAVAPEEFEAREQVLLDRLDRMQGEGGDDDHG